MLGLTLSKTIDIINHEVIIIANVFMRSEKLFMDIAKQDVKEDSLLLTSSIFKIISAEFGDKIRDYAALAVALNKYTENNNQ